MKHAAYTAMSIAVLAVPCLVKAQTPLTRPAVPPDGQTVIFNNPSDASLTLVANLLQDKNPRVREEAASDLGRMGNLACLPFLVKSLGDDQPNVRIAVVRAIGAFPPNRDATAPVVVAMADADPRVAAEAVSCIRAWKLGSAADAVAGMLGRKDPILRETALDAMTAMGKPASADALAGLLKVKDARVLMAAARNAALLTDGRAVVADLSKLAGDASQPSAVRSAAVAALGRFDWNGSKTPIIDPAMKGSDVLMRCGALRAYENALVAEKILPHDLADVVLGILDPTKDQPVPVRLEAVRAAGRQKIVSASKSLLTLMSEAPYDDAESAGPRFQSDDLHLATRTSLEQIIQAGPDGAKEISPVALEMLREAANQVQNRRDANKEASNAEARYKQLKADVDKQASVVDKAKAPDKPAEQKRLEQLKSQLPQAEKDVLAGKAANLKALATPRNLRSYAWLLGRAKWLDAYQPLIELMQAKWLEIDSPIRIEVAEAVGLIGAANHDDRAVEPLLSQLDEQTVAGQRFVAAAAAASLNPPPFNEAVPLAIMGALSEMNVRQAIPALAKTGTVHAPNVWPAHLADAATAAMEKLIGDDQPTEAERKTIIASAQTWLAAKDMQSQGQAGAAIIVGRYAVKDAKVEKLLRDILAKADLQIQDYLPLLQAAAWAIQQTTGQTPALPPVRAKARDFIINPLVK